MPLMSIHNLGRSFGALDIFSEASFSIPHRARIGLVGPNGVGKTTLLRILAGVDEPSDGTIHRARGLTTGYLPQEARLNSSRTLWKEVLTVFEPLLETQAELFRLEHAMADPAQADQALEAYGRLQADFEHRGGYTYENRMQQTLLGLGFSTADYARPLTQLSGGQRTRAMLAKLLLAEPDLLLLDEPTNHLDMQAVEWLENFLKDWRGAAFIVSHDRYFLDVVTNHIYEMTPALESFRGNYSAYVRQREERYQHRLDEYQAQQEFVAKEEEYIRRNLEGQNTRIAQGRRTRLERMLAEARLTPPRQSRKMRFRLDAGSRSGDLVIRTKEVSIGYQDDGKVLFEVPDLTLIRGECAAVIGPNGAGKTTFLKTLLEQIPPLSGVVTLGASLTIGYFAQAHEGLRGDRTLVDEVQEVMPKWLPAEARDYLARFSFTGEDVFKEVKLLSGGERGRLALALLALRGANLLLLDEPTNHLDLPSQELLQSLLGDFGGTILLVSHDRYLIDALATQIWEVDTEDRMLTVFDGTYSEYKAAQAAASQSPPPPPARTEPKRPAETFKKAESTNQARQKREKLMALERQLTELEKSIREIEWKLAAPPKDLDEVTRLGTEYEARKHEQETVFAEWAALTDEIQG